MKKIIYTIAFDLDNTLCISIRKNHPEDILKLKPIKKILNIIKELKKHGHEIVIFTSRDTCDKNARKLTEQWLKKYKIPYNKLITNKPHYDILIDDRVFNPHQSSFINSRRIELECKWIRKNIIKNTYRPRRSK